MYRSIYLYLTHFCNSNCSFCYRRGLFERHPVETLGDKFMKKETVDAILKFAFTQLDLDPKFHIYFWGGEPTANFNIIEYVINKYPQFLYHTNTNGALINEKRYNFFKSHKNFSITWSFGNAYEKYGSVQKKAESEPWMRKVVSEDPNNSVNLMVVKYDRLVEDYNWLRENVTRNITIDIATRHDHTDEDLEVFADQWIKLLMMHRNDPEVFFGLNPAIHSNSYFKEFGLKSQIREFHYCKSGLERLFIDTNGGLWQCDNMYICQHNKLGDVFTGLDYDKLKLAQDIDENREKYLGQHCQTCELYKHCPRNKCLGLNLEHMGDMFKPEPSFCKMCKVLDKITQKYINIQKKEKELVCQTL